MTLETPEPKSVVVYTDGACLGNPGPGGWAAVLLFGEARKELSGGYKLTTNNRMEIMGVLKALGALKERCQVVVHTDSTYLRNAVVKKWIDSWVRNGWRTADKKPVKNKDLWLELIPLLESHDVTFKWVPGHAGVPENERCDVLAKAAASSSGLPDDAAFLASR